MTAPLDRARDALDRVLSIHGAAAGRALTNPQRRDLDAAISEWNAARPANLSDLDPDDGPDVIVSLAERFTEALKHEARAQRADSRRAEIEAAAGEGPPNQPQAGEVRRLGPDQRFADLFEQRDNVRFGELVRGAVSGNWDGIPSEYRLMSVGIGSAGGYAVPESMSARIIDRARAASVVSRAGAQFIPMESAELVVPRLSGGVTGAWKSEGAAMTASDPTFERVTLRAKTLTALVWMSVELFEDSPSAVDTIENELSQALAIELDRACLFGTGAANEPLGIANQSGIGTTAVGGALTGFDNVSAAYKSILGVNLEPDFLAMAPRTWGYFDVLKGGDGQFIYNQGPESWKALTKFVSTSVPITQGTGADTTLIVGKGDEMLVGVRTNLQIETTRQAADASNNAFSELKVGVRAYLRADFALVHPAAFHTLTGVTS